MAVKKIGEPRSAGSRFLGHFYRSLLNKQGKITLAGKNI